MSNRSRWATAPTVSLASAAAVSPPPTSPASIPSPTALPQSTPRKAAAKGASTSRWASAPSVVPVPTAQPSKASHSRSISTGTSSYDPYATFSRSPPPHLVPARQNPPLIHPSPSFPSSDKPPSPPSHPNSSPRVRIPTRLTHSQAPSASLPPSQHPPAPKSEHNPCSRDSPPHVSPLATPSTPPPQKAVELPQASPSKSHIDWAEDEEEEDLPDLGDWEEREEELKVVKRQSDGKLGEAVVQKARGHRENAAPAVEQGSDEDEIDLLDPSFSLFSISTPSVVPIPPKTSSPPSVAHDAFTNSKSDSQPFRTRGFQMRRRDVASSDAYDKGRRRGRGDGFQAARGGRSGNGGCDMSSFSQL